MLEKRSLFDYEVNKLNFYACFLDAVFSLESQDIPKGVIQIVLCMTANYNHCGQGTDGPFVTCQTNPCICPHAGPRARNPINHLPIASFEVNRS